MEGGGTMKFPKPSLLICSCHNTEHQLIFLFDEDVIYKKDSDGKEIEDENGKWVVDRNYSMCYIHTHLNMKPFWERLTYGIKYIFGYQCRYGAFDEFIIKPEDANEFEKVVNYLKRNEVQSNEVSIETEQGDRLYTPIDNQ